MSDQHGSIEAGGDVVGGNQITAGGDAAGRDVIKSAVTVTGFSEKAVQRLLLTVGVMVFVTAACFFSGGVLLGSRVFTELSRPPQNASGQDTGSSLEAASSLQRKLEAANELPRGQPARLAVSEDELSSYFQIVAGPGLGIQAGRVRFIGDNQLAVYGELEAQGNLPFVATLRLRPGSDQVVQAESVAVQLIRIQNSTFGWAAVPVSVAAPAVDSLSSILSSGFSVTGVQPETAYNWVVTVQGR